jgi:hypothetical protein
MAELDLWAVVGAGFARLEELETTWSIDDVDRALGVISMRATIEAQAVKRATKR